MKNKNGFTLIELLGVIAVISLISLIAIPNIVGLTSGVKKDSMLDDAKKLISLAKREISVNAELRSSPPHTFTFAELNVNGDIENDPDGGQYDPTNSYVTYKIENNTAIYCVVLIGSKRVIGSSTNCIPEDTLYSRSKVMDKPA